MTPKEAEAFATLKQERDDLRKERVHLSHCNFGENEGSCKYGDDSCPALSESWSWFGKALQERDQLRAEVERLSAEFKQLADTAYCDYIAQMRRPECLGWEAKIKSGKFGERELNAHTYAGQLLGKHRAYADAARRKP